MNSPQEGTSIPQASENHTLSEEVLRQIFCIRRALINEGYSRDILFPFSTDPEGNAIMVYRREHKEETYRLDVLIPLQQFFSEKISAISLRGYMKDKPLIFGENIDVSEMSIHLAVQQGREVISSLEQHPLKKEKEKEKKS